MTRRVTPRVPVPPSPRPAAARLAACVVAVALAAPVAGCISRGARMTASEQQSFGTRTFAAPYDVTFAAARDALPLLGYTLDFVSPAQGRITTGRKQVGARAEVGFGGLGATPLWRRYILQISRLDAAHTRVIATPHLFAGDRDISHEQVWTRDGPEGEYAQWRALFAQIEAGLAR